MTDFKCGLFDLDGTLLDSMGVWLDIDRRFFAAHNIPLPDDYFSSISGRSFHDTAVYTKERFSLSESTEEIMCEWNRMAEEEYRLHIQLKPGARAYLEKLRYAGKRLAVVTTLPPSRFIPCLERLGIKKLFEVFVCTDDISSTKSDGLAYTYAAGRMNVLPRDCMVFEDIPEGIEGAKKAGMKACLVYDASSLERQKTAISLSDEYIGNWNQAGLPG